MNMQSASGDEAPAEEVPPEPDAELDAAEPDADAAEADAPAEADGEAAEADAPDAATGADVGGFPQVEGEPLAAPAAGGPQPRSAPAPAPALRPAPQAAAALPAGSGTLDSATVQRIVDRLVALHFLSSAMDAQNPELIAQAIRDFQLSAGISPTATLDRDTIGRLTTP
jgi:hypothetical protein